MTRREAREEAFLMLFEAAFQPQKDPEEIYALATEVRDIPENEYIHNVFFGVLGERDAIDAMIARHSNGWKPDRLSFAAISVLRLSVYEMLHSKDVPANVSLNEAVELIKKYDDPKARAFVNGVLNAIKNEIESEERP